MTTALTPRRYRPAALVPSLPTGPGNGRGAHMHRPPPVLVPGPARRDSHGGDGTMMTPPRLWTAPAVTGWCFCVSPDAAILRWSPGLAADPVPRPGLTTPRGADPREHLGLPCRRRWCYASSRPVPVMGAPPVSRGDVSRDCPAGLYLTRHPLSNNLVSVSHD